MKCLSCIVEGAYSGAAWRMRPCNRSLSSGGVEGLQATRNHKGSFGSSASRRRVSAGVRGWRATFSRTAEYGWEAHCARSSGGASACSLTTRASRKSSGASNATSRRSSRWLVLGSEALLNFLSHPGVIRSSSRVRASMSRVSRRSSARFFVRGKGAGRIERKTSSRCFLSPKITWVPRKSDLAVNFLVRTSRLAMNLLLRVE